MAENINLRPVGELPEAESISDGDKALLVDVNGVAKQIPASKLGGSGGGGHTIYAEATLDGTGGNNNLVYIYWDEAHSNAIKYDEAKQLFKSGVVIWGTLNGMSAALTPLTIIPVDEAKMLRMVACPENIMFFAVICADTNG